MRAYLLGLLIGYPLFTTAQSATPPCDCPSVLQQVSRKVADNYAGWTDKVTAKTKPAHTRLLDSLQQQATKATTDADCFQLLKAYKAFFRDGHFQVELRNTGSAATPAPAPVVGVRTIPLSEAQAQQLLLDKAKKHHPVEGIWETPERSYKLAIIPDPQSADSLVGVVLASTNPRWTPGLVKLKLATRNPAAGQVLYRNGAFEEESLRLAQTGNLFRIGGYGYWLRRFPQAVTEAEQQTVARQAIPIEFRQLSPQVAYLRVTSFNTPKAQVDSMVRVHQSALRQTPTLIIDIRDNGGGSNSSFASLLPLMNTNNFQDTHTYMRTSPDNIAAEEAMVARARAGHWDTDSVLNVWATDVAQAKAHPNQLYRTEGSLLKIDSVLTNPVRVAVLMNANCYSSAEYFAFYAKQSRKATLFGQHTGGVMDYGNVRNQVLDCPHFVLRLPTTRSGWVDTAPIDNRGFQPDVVIPATEPDWVDYVVRYYQSPTEQPRR